MHPQLSVALIARLLLSPIIFFEHVKYAPVLFNEVFPERIYIIEVGSRIDASGLLVSIRRPISYGVLHRNVLQI
jgi:hypothetical protein